MKTQRNWGKPAVNEASCEKVCALQRARSLFRTAINPTIVEAHQKRLAIIMFAWLIMHSQCLAVSLVIRSGNLTSQFWSEDAYVRVQVSTFYSRGAGYDVQVFDASLWEGEYQNVLTYSGTGPDDEGYYLYGVVKWDCQKSIGLTWNQYTYDWNYFTFYDRATATLAAIRSAGEIPPFSGTLSVWGRIWVKPKYSDDPAAFVYDYYIDTPVTLGYPDTSGYISVPSLPHPLLPTDYNQGYYSVSF